VSPLSYAKITARTRSRRLDDLALAWHERCKPLDEREAEGEGFEPSIRLTTDNGFRDRLETAHLQGF